MKGQTRLSRPRVRCHPTGLTDRQRALLRLVRADGVVTEDEVARVLGYRDPRAALRRLERRRLVEPARTRRGAVVPGQWRAKRIAEQRP
jgi:hypothetical protein